MGRLLIQLHMEFPRKPRGRPPQRQPQPKAAEGPKGVQHQIVYIKGPAHKQLPGFDKPRDTHSCSKGSPPGVSPPQKGREKAKRQEHDNVAQQCVQQNPAGGKRLKGDQIHVPQPEKRPRPAPAQYGKQVESPRRQRQRRHTAAKHPKQRQQTLPQPGTDQPRSPQSSPPPRVQAGIQRQRRQSAGQHPRQILPCEPNIPHHIALLRAITPKTISPWRRRAGQGPSP